MGTRIIAIAVVLMVEGSIALYSAPPAGWFMAGNKPTDYDASADPAATYLEQPSILMKSIRPTAEGFGTMMQCFRGQQYLGKRIRFSANVKSTGIDAPGDWAGLLFRHR